MFTSCCPATKWPKKSMNADLKYGNFRWIVKSAGEWAPFFVYVVTMLTDVLSVNVHSVFLYHSEIVSIHFTLRVQKQILACVSISPSLLPSCNISSVERQPTCVSSMTGKRLSSQHHIIITGESTVCSVLRSNVDIKFQSLWVNFKVVSCWAYCLVSLI